MSHLFRSFSGVVIVFLLAACGGQATTAGTGGTAGAGAGGNAGGAAGTGGQGGAAGATTGGGMGGIGGGAAGMGGAIGGNGGAAGMGGMGGGTAGMGGTGGMGGGTAGMGGTGGMGGAWPTCDSPPTGVPERTIPEIWQQNPATAEEVWVPGVYVTAVSGGACALGQACQLFVQQKETFASIAEGSHKALRVFIAPAAAEHFTGIAVADRIDLRASAYRHTQGGENELYFHVSPSLPGCAKVIGQGAPVPVAGLDLADLTIDLYEQTMGPLFIRLETVSGKPKAPNQTFTLWESFMPGMQPIEEVTSVSPYFAPGSKFTGLTPDIIHNFKRIDGVFGIFAPQANPLIKYEEIYIRTMADVEYGGQ